MNILKWFYFLSKRLYKKWMFVLIICLVPLSVAALKITSNQKSGFVQIAIVNLSGSQGDKIIENLNDTGSIISYTYFTDTETAIDGLKADKFDSVWVLPESIEERIADFVKKPNENNYIVEVYKREESLKTRLALERLSGAIFPFTSRQFFLKSIREDKDLALSNLTDEQIYKYYDDYFNNGSLFKFAFPDDNTSVKQGEQNHITSPIRGLLSAVVLLAGLSGCMLYITDEKRGVFSFTKSSNRLLISFAFELTAIINVFAFVFISVYVLGVNTYLFREIAVSLIFVINTALFCTLICNLIKNTNILAPVSILITVLDIFICPIFFDYWIQKKPQLLLPNTYYINSVHSNIYLKYSLIYTAVLTLILLCFYLKKRKE